MKHIYNIIIIILLIFLCYTSFQINKNLKWIKNNNFESNIKKETFLESIIGNTYLTTSLLDNIYSAVIGVYDKDVRTSAIWLYQFREKQKERQ